MKPFKILLLSSLLLVGTSNVYADNDDDPIELPKEIILIGTGTHNPSIPQAPSYIRLSATVDGCGVTVSSNVDVMAQVQIIGSDSGAIYYDSIVALAPSCRCYVPTTGESLTIHVLIGDSEYIGYFEIN